MEIPPPADPLPAHPGAMRLEESSFPSRYQPARNPRGYPVAAWIVIALCVIAVIVMNVIELPDESKAKVEGAKEDPLGVALMEIQSKVMVGAAGSSGGGSTNNSLVGLEGLNMGTFGQRARFVILTAELEGPEAAADRLAELEDDIANAILKSTDKDPFRLNVRQRDVLNALRSLYPPAEPDGEESEEESTTDDLDRERNVLVQELGWMGRLALTHANPDDKAARDAVLAPAQRMFVFVFLIGFLLIGAGLLGFIGLVLLIVFTFTGRIRNHLPATPVHHGLYAETFAVWMVLFLGFQLIAGVVAEFAPDMALVGVGVSFFASLLALGWPVMRGASWRQVRYDIGWTFGHKPALEPLLGFGGYLIALPIFFVGALITVALVLIQQMFIPQAPMFEPLGGPAHPIVENLIGPNWGVRIQLLLLGSIAAPIIEETMFRGVLYRHLRDGSAKAGLILSIVIGAFVNSFIFAIIHPQGWVAVPALMSLAIGFTILREWRGTLVPSMIMHGIQNGLVFSILILAMSL